MSANFDYGTLNWVKGEIDETLKQARTALEAYVEQPDDETQLRFFGNHIHQVHGTLRMVEIFGAAMAAEEMEALTQALLDGKVSNRDDAYQALMHGTLQLPDYLEKLQGGQRDMPVLLLPLLNDLRAARGAALLSESAFFSPNLSTPTPLSTRTAEEPADEISALARKLRHAYQLGLLGWFRDRDSEASLKRIGAVIDKLYKSATQPKVAQVFWVASGVVEALRHGGLKSSIAVKLLLGQMDRQIKHLMDSGEEAMGSESPTELLKNLLYYVAQSTSKGHRVATLKSAFKLAELLPDAQALDEAREKLAAPNTSVMQSVSAVLQEDLSRVKDSLDVFVRSESRDPSVLTPLCEELDKMADTLGMLGLGNQRDVVQKQIANLQAIAGGSRVADDDTLMEVAGALLSVEVALHELTAPQHVSEEQLQAASSEEEALALRSQADGDYREVVRRAVSEAKAELQSVKEAVAAFGQTPSDYSLLDSLPERLSKIHGGFLILNLERAAQVVTQCSDIIKNLFIDSHTVPEPAMLDRLADAIASIEYYMESMSENWGRPSAILDVAQRSLEDLDRLADEAPASTAAETEASQAPDLAVEPTSESELAAEFVSPAPLAPELEPEPQVEFQPEAELEIDAAALESPMSLDQVEMEAEAAPLDLDLGVADETVPSTHDEAVSIPQDMGSAVARLSEALELWLFDPTDAGTTELLRTLIAQIDEQARAANLERAVKIVGDMETIVSHAAEAGQAPTEDIVNTLHWASDTLRDLLGEDAAQASDSAVEQLPAVEAEPDVEPAPAEVAASQPVEEIHAAVEEPAPTPIAEAQPTSAAASSSAPRPAIEDMDEEILEIFLEEAQEELANISTLLPQWRANTDDEESLTTLRRSFHTLKGSGRLVGAVDVGEFAWAYESVLNRVIDRTVVPSEDLFTLLELGHPALERLLEMFKSGGEPSQDILQLMECAHALSRGAEITLPEAGPATEPAPLAAVTDELPSPSSEPEPEAELVSPPAGEELIAPSVPEEDAFELAFDVEPEAASPEPEAASAGPEVDSAARGLESSGGNLEPAATEPETLLPPPRDIDPTLLEIYRSESEGHLADLRAIIERCRNSVDQCGAHEQLVRAWHTLQGSSRATGVPEVAELSGAFEKYVKLAQQKNLGGSAAAADLMLEGCSFIEGVISLLDQPGAVVPDHQSLLRRVERFIDEAVQMPAPEPEAPKPTAEPEPAPHVEYDDELIEIFLEEGAEILDNSEHTLQQWLDDRDNNELVETMQRQLHTLKGGARMAGVTAIGDLSHSLESLLTAVADGHQPVTQRMFDVLQLSQDRLATMLEQARDRASLQQAGDLKVMIDELLGTGEYEGSRAPEAAPAEPPSLPHVGSATSSTDSLTLDRDVPAAPMEKSSDEAAGILASSEPLWSPAPELPQVSAVPAPAPVAEAPTEESPDHAERRRGPRIQQEQVRVRADLLDNLVNYAGEVSIYRSRLEQQVNSFRYNLQELDDTVARLRNQLRNFEIEAEAQIQYRFEEATGRSYDEFDPLEFDRFTYMQQLSRGMLESLGDLDSLRSLLTNVTRESETLLLQQSRVNTDLQEGLMRTRMVPFGMQAPRLRRVVRQACNDLDKRAELNLMGSESELDRTVLDRIMAPLEHMLRNAVAHGIEMPEARRAHGKDEAGTINIELSKEGSEIVLTVADDGAGIDLEAVRAKAISRGLLKPDTPASEQVLLDMILESGFSTAEEVTQVAGRGVGMDVVASELKQLGGTFAIATKPGAGTKFTVRLPLTLSITQALMVGLNEDIYALPLLSVEGIERINHEELETLYQADNPVYNWVGQDYRFLNLGRMMGGSDAPLPGPGKKAPLLLVRSGDYRAALHVNALMGSREVVVKSVGPQLATLRGVSGATITGDGSVVLILDLAVLVRHGLTQALPQVVETAAAAPAEVASEAPTVMVVDDSITVRKVTTRLLERHGMNVITAKDGVDALATLQEVTPDIMLLDIEMPRMDGFELATNVRNDDRLKKVPIIMITSRTGQKHQDRAKKIGVERYMGKPFQETELFETIEELLGTRVLH